MADEPILCFDGDRAGQKAAWRAADLALPHLKPGKSLRFALLPEGQDPDDLARSGGRGRDRGSDLGRARPCRHDLVARDRGRHLMRRRSGAPRWKRKSANSPTASATRWCGAIIARIWPSVCSRPLRRKAAGAATAGAISAAPGGFGGESGRRFAPRGLRARRGGRFGSAAAAGRAPAAPGLGRGPYQADEPPSGLEPDHARPALRAVAPRGADPAIPD